MNVGQPLSDITSSTRVCWSNKIGRMHYRNSIIAVGDRIIVSTSGAVWNESDSGDGIYALDARSGELLWHSATLGDANGILSLGSMIVGGTDAGQMFAIDVLTGTLRASYSVGEPVFCKPVVVRCGLKDVAALVSYSGKIVLFDPDSEQFRVVLEVNGDFRANPATEVLMASEGGFVLGSEAGELIKIEIDHAGARASLISVLRSRKSSYGNYFLSIIGIGSLLVADGDLIVSYVRETYDKHPPIVCIGLVDGVERWHARGVKTLSKKREGYGNARTTPVLDGGFVYSTFGYNDGLHAFSLATGRGEWMAQLDDGLFQNWASPIIGKNDRLFVPRVNGLIYEVDTLKRKVMNAISVEIGRYVDNRSYHRRRRHFNEDSWDDTSLISSETKWDKVGPDPDEILVAGIASTPLFQNGFLITGGISGDIQCYRVE